MIILGIDTTSKFLCLGIYKNGKIYESNLNLGIRHSEQLIPKLKLLLDKARVSMKDIEYIACGLGPGSFTGIRIGLATAKGFAYGLNKPLVAMSSLDILAKNAESQEDSLICPIIDAKRELVYSSVYKIKNNKVERISPYMLVSPRELLKKIVLRQKMVFLGDGLRLYKEIIYNKFRGKVKILDERFWNLKARNILELALELIKQKKFSDVLKIKPIYLYPKECQIRK